MNEFDKKGNVRTECPWPSTHPGRAKGPRVRPSDWQELRTVASKIPNRFITPFWKVEAQIPYAFAITYVGNLIFSSVGIFTYVIFSSLNNPRNLDRCGYNRIYLTMQKKWSFIKLNYVSVDIYNMICKTNFNIRLQS